jgi:serine/threonine-protein kinase
MDDLREQLQSALGSAYRIERELHGGGMSRVFLAEETRFERRVVIKVLSPELAVGLSSERFEREIKLAAQLQQANIVSVHSAGEVGGLPYYTMPFVEGESLRARLGRGQLSTTEAVAILRDLARALSYAHGKGVVHRDIKPENVLLSGEAAVVTDFGIAKAVSESKTNAPGGTLTVMGTSLGTPAYMAPEQAVGDSVDQRADIYAWGIVAYEILTGAHPFAGKSTAQQWITAHLAEKPKPVQDRRPGLPKGLSALVMRALEKEPANRPQSANEILPALEDPTLMRSGAGTGRREISPHETNRRFSTGTVAGGLIAVALVLAAILGREKIAAVMHGSGVAATADTSASSDAGAINTVAVVPFTNTGGNAQDEYFSDGMTDELAHALSRLPSLRVAARTSTYAFKGKTASAQDIGRALNVRGVIEGTVRRAGNRLRVTAQLSSAKDGLVVWSDSYESRATDVFALQDEFTKAIVSAIAPSLSGGAAGTAASTSRGTDSPEAYDLYLKGRYFWAKRGAAALYRAVSFFQDAIKRDPKFARAYADLALAQVILPEYSTAAGDSMIDIGVANAGRALVLDSTIADAQLALGFAGAYRLKLADAERAYAAALRLEPLNATAHMWHAVNLETGGDIDGALTEMRRAVELDPLSAVDGGNFTTTLNFAGRFRDALAQGMKVLEIDSTLYASTHAEIAFAYAFLGRPDSALREMETYARVGPDEPVTPGYRLFALAAAGKWAQAKSLRAEILRGTADKPGDANAFFAHLAFGDRAGALTSLEQSFKAGTSQLITQSPSCDPIMQPLKSEPRYVALMKSAGLRICPADVHWPIGTAPS